MEFFLDTINLDKIAQFQEIIPVAGVTLTPSIIKREGKVDFFEHAKKIRQLIGSKRTLHIQLVAADCEQLIKDAQAVWQNVDSEVFVKIPLSLDGLKAIQYLKKQGPCHITATATYSRIQGMLAMAEHANYLAVYTSRVENIDGNFPGLIKSLKTHAANNHYGTKIMASSIKSVRQITAAAEAGADAVTFAPDVLTKAFENGALTKALTDFTDDWEALYNKRHIY